MSLGFDSYWKSLSSNTTNLNLPQLKKAYKTIQKYNKSETNNNHSLNTITFNKSQLSFINYVEKQLKNNTQFLLILSGGVGTGTKNILSPQISKFILVFNRQNTNSQPYNRSGERNYWPLWTSLLTYRFEKIILLNLSFCILS